MNYRIITLDFESFYAQDYSLNFMPMQEYILDPRFEVIGVAVSIDGAYPRWVPGHGAAHLYLQSLNLKEPGTIVVAHNAMFDGGILEFQLGIRPWIYFCTMMGARPNLVPITSNGRMSLAALAEHVPEVGDKGGFITHAKGKRFHDFTTSQLSEYGDYCIRDTAICEALYRKITANMPSGEQDLLDLTIKKFTRPQVKLDSSVLAQELQRIRTDKARLLERVGMSDAKELNSNPKFAQALVGAGLPEAQVPRKLSPATNKETFAFAKTDAEFRALKDHPNETVQALVAARMGHKSTLAETRTERFLTLSQFDRFAVPLLYWGARPGRFSGYDKLNCQNLPRKGALRKAIKAPKGYKIVAGDLSQIEARMVALLAGEQKLLNQFAAGVDVYSHFAADHIFNTSLSSIGDLERFFGKTCLGADTLVLTKRGWIPIVQVQHNEQVWDGIEWVSHAGVVHVGEKETLTFNGVTATPDHEIWTGSSWVEWQEVQKSPTLFQSALSSATLPSFDTSGTYPKQGRTGATNLSAAARAAQKIRYRFTTYAKDAAHGAMPAQRLHPAPNGIGNTKTPCTTPGTALGYSIAYPLASIGAINPLAGLGATMVGEVLQWLKNGATTALHSCAMFRPSPAGMPPSTSWTARMSTGTMSQETSALSAEAKTWRTSGKSETCKQNLPVYDLLYAGPRKRFTILSKSGPLCVSNSILGLGYGMGPAKFETTILNAENYLPPEMFRKVKTMLTRKFVNAIVYGYRDHFNKISELWNIAGTVWINMLLEDKPPRWSRATQSGQSLFFGKGFIGLPNGMSLRYTDLRFESMDGNTPAELIYGRGKNKYRLYGAKLVENVVQALSRIIVTDAELFLAARGYRAVLSVHDELVYCILESKAEQFAEVLSRVLTRPVSWAPDLPLACETGVGDNYGDAKP